MSSKVLSVKGLAVGVPLGEGVGRFLERGLVGVLSPEMCLMLELNFQNHEVSK